MQATVNQSELLKKYIDFNKSQINLPNTVKQNTNVNLTEVRDSYVKREKDKKIQKSKKYKIAKIALFASMFLTGAVSVLVGIRNRSKIGKFINEVINKIKAGKHPNEIKNADMALKGSKRQNLLDAIINGKDTITRKVLWNVPGYKKYYDNPTSNLYRKITKNVMTGNWRKAISRLNSADDAIIHAMENSNTDAKTVARIKELLEKRNNAVGKFGSERAFSQRFEQIDKSLRNLHEDGWQKITDKSKTLMQKIKGAANENLAQGRIDKARKLRRSLMGGFENYSNIGLNSAEAKELSSFIENLTKNNPKLLSKIQKAEKVYTKTYAKEVTDMMYKLRDINFGSAPTDVMTLLTTTGALGIYTAQADSRAERTEVALTTGVPLLGALLGTTICQAKMKSGAQSMLIGLGIGIVARLAGKTANKAYKNYYNIHHQKTIPTVEDYVEKLPTNQV